MQTETSSKEKHTKAIIVFILVPLLVVSLSILYFNGFFKEFLSFSTKADLIEENRYGVDFDLPNGWIATACEPDPEEYPGGFQYVCRWVSPPHPESGERTTVALFASEDPDFSSEEFEAFVSERQKRGWAGDMESDPNLGVFFDDTPELVVYGEWGGLRVDDYVEYAGTRGHFLTSTDLFSQTPYGGVILEVNHIDEIENEVYYSVEDVLRWVSILR